MPLDGDSHPRRRLRPAAGPPRRKQACADLRWMAREGWYSRRLWESALFPSRTPFPHPERGWLGQCVTQLAGQRADLSAMVSIMRDQVAEHPDDIRAEAFDFAGGVIERFLQELRTALRAGGERTHGFLLSHCQTVELFGQRLALSGSHQPHMPHVVHVRGDGGDGAALAAGRFSVPGRVIQIFQQILVDALVDSVGLQERQLQIEHWITLAPERKIT